MELGKRIRDIRISQSLTLETLSYMADIDTSYLSEVERGESNITFLTLIKIAKQLGCNIAFFSKKTPKKTFLINIDLKKEEEQYLIELGNQIREMRHSKAWTQKTMAEKAGIDRAYLSKIERGIRNVAYLTMVKLADILDCDVAAFTKDIPQ